ncbi:transcription factor EGL1-like isoform X1 [Cornus florida]|uniref:transcription factor EGL1-like isoform X1 n=1 Tax=Cornus florida TaxID=4283 RepID=UPI002898EE7E|nr:transcription factor EGL1-like isoform X1 [Cornus florida]
MASSGLQNQDGLSENLKKQLAIAVRSIQWSYAIFWSISSRQPGVLEWGDGYYNGDIKTRKTVQAVEFNADQLGLQRSEQLKELYESLSVAETNPQARRPSAALSPEDLTDTEWYYLVCMSFVFNIGQGLPGRTLANGQPIWLCNAHCADSKVFSRSLLAKSASIQTVVCFPFLGGVVELGVTELVLEDPTLIQHIKTTFLENPYPTVPKISNYASENTRTDKDLVLPKLNHNKLDTNLDPAVECREVNLCAPNNTSSGFLPNQQTEESVMVEGLNGGVSQVQSWQFMDDEVSNCVQNSSNSSDSISQTFVTPEKDSCLLDLQECNHTKLTSLDLPNDDIHYHSVVSSLLKSSHQLVLGPYFQKCHKESSFIDWKKGPVGIRKHRSGTPQRVLKKVLFEVARMHGGRLIESRQDNSREDGLWRPQVDEIGTTNLFSGRRRRENINERYSVLGSLIPSTSKVDKVSILDGTIEYLKELERRVDDLECCREVTDLDAMTRKKPQDTTERTSDNYGNSTGIGKRPSINKRKACDIDGGEPEINLVQLKDSSTDNVTVKMTEKDVLIEIRCPWRECLLLEIMDAISNFHLDSHSVQSSNVDGILSLNIKSKFKGSTVASTGMIIQALQRVICMNKPTL